MFWSTILLVWSATRIAVPSLDGLSSIITTSAASIAASLPNAPMAIPTSALMITGASLIPSPTKARRFLRPLGSFAASSSTFLTLSSGSRFAYISLIPTCSATSFAICRLSPVSMTMDSTPRVFSSFIASLASGLISSETMMYPAKTLSTATYTTVRLRSHESWRMFSMCISSSFPAMISFPSIKALTPRPGISR